ncbi:uncharacterized protein VTP21DRAFT_928 [Calcarisporiella thermophila]|uniref:uncharacterized protein n=1 Tax=Calcarisporiella thermophila TaxID=911321 RepID=UPI0037449B46
MQRRQGESVAKEARSGGSGSSASYQRDLARIFYRCCAHSLWLRNAKMEREWKNKCTPERVSKRLWANGREEDGKTEQVEFLKFLSPKNLGARNAWPLGVRLPYLFDF